MRNNNRGKDEKKFRSKKSKGFSLFTPLVGTAVIIIAILISITMIQNNLRISEGISDSYISSQQATGSQLIETSASVQIIGNIERRIYRVLEEGIETTCDSKTSCITSTTNKLDNWERIKTRVYPVAYDDVRDRLFKLGYFVDMKKPCDFLITPGEPGGRDPRNPQNCMDVAVRRVEEDLIHNVEYNENEGILRASLYPNSLDPYKEAFHLNLTNKRENITISQYVIPGEVTGETIPINNEIEKTAEAFNEVEGEYDLTEIEDMCDNLLLGPLAKCNTQNTCEFRVFADIEGESSALHIRWLNIGRGMELRYNNMDELGSGDWKNCVGEF